MIDHQAFQRFLDAHAADFRGISGATRGEWKPDDVRQQAWLLAVDLGDRRQRPLDLDDADDASLLVRSLYNHCVKYTERVVRHAHKLDHAAPGDDDRDRHWLLDHLVADGGGHPAQWLEASEAATPERDAPDPYHSPAAGWASVLHRFDCRMADVADFLLISTSWCRRCYHRALWLAHMPSPLPDLRSEGDAGDALRPWRSFRLPARTPAEPFDGQPALDFRGRPPDPAHGQMWLL